MKKLFALVVLICIALTGCGQASSTQPLASAAAVAEQTIAVPNVEGLTLDKANDQLKELGLKVDAEDVNDQKTILSKKNWQVVSQDPLPAVQVAKDSKVKLGVRHLTDETASPSPTPTQEPAKLVAPPAVVETPPAVVAPPAVVEAPPVVPAVPAKPPVVEAPPVAPVAPYYANCAAVRAAGAAPISSSQPGYGRHLDRDGDGWGCDK